MITSESINPEAEIKKDTQWGNNFVVIVSSETLVPKISTKTQWGSNFIINVKVKNLEHADEIAEKLSEKIFEKLRSEVSLGARGGNTSIDNLGHYKINVVSSLMTSIWNSPLMKALR